MKLRRSLHWGSHLPVLIRMTELVTEGDILELGTGIYSTPFLHYICMLQGRKLVSYENNINYYNVYKDYQCDFHDVIFIEDWADLDIRRRDRWEIAFIDCNPEEERAMLARKLRAYANYVVIHDSQPEVDNITQYSEIYPLFRKRYDYTKESPSTTILSNFRHMNFYL